MKRTFFLLLLGIGLIGSFLTSCKRDTMPQLERPVQGDTNENLLKDSVYLYTYFFYLWQEDLPDRFQTRNYNSAEAVLEALKNYARDPQGNALDRFSFLDRTGTVETEIQQGMAGSLGLDVRYQSDNELYVKKVDPQSPAHAAGIKRGWQILTINGNSDLSLASMQRDNFAFLFDALDGSAISLVLKKTNGEDVSVDLNRAQYQIQPILANHIYTVGTKKVGYFAFDVFVSTENLNGSPTYVKNQLDQLMAQFEQAGVEELIVDLRYNGGGAVITADYLTNLLAPSSVGHGLMYEYKVNATLTEDGWTEDVFPPQYFDKKNTLELKRIYFLVTEGTASASELLINNLRPHLDVKLIGENHTYGKPVGYFAWDILNVNLYAVSFQTFNSAGYGDYFSGLPVDKLAYDDLTRDFGDADEEMIAEALHYARTGSFSMVSPSLQLSTQTNLHSRLINLNKLLDQRTNRNMFRFNSPKLIH